MKKNKKLMIWGSNLFLGMTFDNSKDGYVYLASSCIMQLHNKYNVSNFSMNHLSSGKALHYLLKALKYDNNYDVALLELGFVDLINIANQNEELNDFETNLSSMIEVLIINKIKPYLTTLFPIDFDKMVNHYKLSIDSKQLGLIYKRINRVIKNLAIKYEIDLLDDNRALSKNKEEYVSTDGVSISCSGQNVLFNMINRKNL